MSALEEDATGSASGGPAGPAAFAFARTAFNATRAPAALGNKGRRPCRPADDQRAITISPLSSATPLPLPVSPVPTTVTS